MVTRNDTEMARYAEATILSAVMLDPRCYHRVARDLAGVAWSTTAHGLIWTAMSQIAAAGGVVDTVSLCDRLGPALEQAGGVDYLTRLDQECVTSAGIEGHAAVIASLSKKRAVVEVLRTALSTIMASDSGSWTLEAAPMLGQLAAAVASTAQRVTWPAAVEQYIDALRSVVDGTRQAGIRTGLHGLDQMTGGFRPGELTFACARPAVGKSALAYNIAANIATGRSGMRPARVVIWSGELPYRQVAGRLLLAHARGVRTEAVRNRCPSEAELDMLHTSRRAMLDAPVHVLTQMDCTTMDGLAGELLHIEAAHGPIGLVVIDQAPQIRPSGYEKDRFAGIRECAHRGKALAQRMDIPFLALNQVNRQAEERSNGVPTKRDVWGADDVEQWADVLMLLWRNRVIQPEGAPIFRINVAKQREGPTGMVELEDRLEFGCLANPAGQW